MHVPVRTTWRLWAKTSSGRPRKPAPPAPASQPARARPGRPMRSKRVLSRKSAGGSTLQAPPARPGATCWLTSWRVQQWLRARPAAHSCSGFAACPETPGVATALALRCPMTRPPKGWIPVPQLPEQARILAWRRHPASGECRATRTPLYQFSVLQFSFPFSFF